MLSAFHMNRIILLLYFMIFMYICFCIFYDIYVYIYMCLWCFFLFNIFCIDSYFYCQVKLMKKNLLRDFGETFISITRRT